MNTWDAMVDPDDETRIAVSRPEGPQAYDFSKAEARGIRDALNELSEEDLT